MAKKIVLFTPTLNIGGIERVFMTYAQLLAKRGYNVTYLVCYDNGDFKNELAYNIRIHNLGTNNLKSSLWKLVTFIHKEQPDDIIVANSVTLIVLLAKWMCLSNVNIITSHHNYLNSEVKSWLEKHLVWKAYNYCSSVIAISKGLNNLLLEKKVSPQKIHLIYNPIYISNILKMAQCKIDLPFEDYIVFIGRLSIVKNIKLLIDAIYEINKMYRLPLLIVGDGVERSYLERRVSQLGIQNIVCFIGNQPNPYPFIKNARLVALSSESEAFPTVLLESLALGKTIVSTPTNGALEILENGKYGYISKSYNDVDDFKITINNAYNNPIDASLLTDYLNQKFSPEVTIDKLETLL